MADSAIEWTDKTWNPVTGCSKVSPGCAHCYAETVAVRLWGKQYKPVSIASAEYPDAVRPRAFEDVRMHGDRLEQPLRWKNPARIFVNSMSDLFHENVPDAFIDQVFAVMALAHQHTFQVLTKRAERMRAYFLDLSQRTEFIGISAEYRSGLDRHPNMKPLWPLPLPNVWLGVSVENQAFLHRIDSLKDTPAAVHFVSFEPLLEDLGAVLLDGIQWAIVGGESGPKARPFNVRWARSIVRQCQRAGVAVFVKQLGRDVRDRNDAGFLGEWPESWPERIDILDRVEHDLDGTRDGYQGAPVRIHLDNRKGGDPAEWPEDLRVRQFPQPKGTSV